MKSLQTNFGKGPRFIILDNGEYLTMDKAREIAVELVMLCYGDLIESYYSPDNEIKFNFQSKFLQDYVKHIYTLDDKEGFKLRRCSKCHQLMNHRPPDIDVCSNVRCTEYGVSNFRDDQCSQRTT